MIDTDKIKFILGKETSDYLMILVENFAYPDSTDFWDGNWINTRIKIKVGGFNGEYSAQLRNVDFMDFKNELERLYNKLDGYANFNCLEDYIQIKIKGDGLGHFSADCVANDNPGIYGNELKFSIEFDQTEINSLTNGDHYHWDLEMDDDWVDTELFSKIVALTNKYSTKGKLTYFDTGGQDLVLGWANKEQLNKIRERTGLDIVWLE